MELMMTTTIDAAAAEAPLASYGVPGVEYNGLESLVLAEHEKGLIVEALRRCDGCKTRAAVLLGLTRFALLRRLKEYGIRAERPKQEPPPRTRPYRRRTHVVPVP